jgi:hypothetical protein
VTYDNDGRFPDGAAVQARYPVGRRSGPDRDAWPWLDATVEQQCGPDEWLVTIEDRRVAELEDGTPAPAGTPDDQLLFPMCFRDASELRPAGRRLCAHADLDAQGMHWLEPGQPCRPAAGPDREAGQ